LRRVAVLIAAGAAATDVFAAVAKEAAATLDVPLTAVVRFAPPGMATQVGACGAENPFPVGTSWPLDATSVSGLVARTGQSARVNDYADIPGPVSGRLAREAGIRTAVGAPILVDGETWGAMMALSTELRPLPADTETRLAAFTELVATAISSIQARDDLHHLADEQAALRRVATLVAHEASAEEVFAAVAEEVAEVLDVQLVQMSRYLSDDTVTVVGSWGDQPMKAGSRWPLDGPTLSARVLQTGQPARIDDYSTVPGTIGRVIREAGIRAGVGAPVVVDGRLWGVLMVISREPVPLPADTEDRLTNFTELVATAIANTQARHELHELAEEQAALRRVATVVAQEGSAEDVFAAVAEEVARTLDLPLIEMARFEPDGTTRILGSAGEHPFQAGTEWPLDGPSVSALVRETGLPARIDDFSAVAGTVAQAVRQSGVRSGVGVPIIVGDRVWGMVATGSTAPEPLPPQTEGRLTAFTELIATAVANANARSELIASRSRIVTAGDDARRRLERNLHDGTQQRLVALALDLKAARSLLAPEQVEVRAELERLEDDTERILEEVRELSRGLHPALLFQGGLRSALRAMARRSPIDVDLEVRLETTPPEPVETAAYFVVAEAVTNAAKHSHAASITVVLEADADVLHAEIADDGVGGAEASAGSGLVGLIDRVEALGGRLALHSPAGEGTKITVELPLAAQVSAVEGQRLRTTEQLVDATALLAAVAELGEAVYIVDAQGRVRLLNEAAVRILGYDDEGQLLGRPSHDTIHYLHRDGTPFPAADCPLLRPRVTGDTVRVDEDWFVRQDGTFVEVSYSSAPISLPDGRGAVVWFRERLSP
jgi:PAS domain S-box-containing protein